MRYPMKISRFLIFIVFLFCRGTMSGQITLSWDESYHQLKWSEFIRQVENQYPVRFYYNTDSFPDLVIPGSTEGNDFTGRLNSVLGAYDYRSTLDSDGNIFITKHNSIHTSIPAGFFKGFEDQHPLNCYQWKEQP